MSNTNDNEQSFEERLRKVEEELRKSKADRKKIREALRKLVQQEKAARGQINLGEIIDILRDEGDENG